MVAMSSNPRYTAALLRKGSRIAGRLNSDWYCVYVQTPEERADRIDSSVQRKLVDNIQLAQSMGAEVVKLEGTDVADTLARFAIENGVTVLVIGQSKRSRLHHLLKGSVVDKLVKNVRGLDVFVVSFDTEGAEQESER
jgi:two-component system sensor histidine kinase KdpD